MVLKPKMSSREMKFFDYEWSVNPCSDRKHSLAPGSPGAWFASSLKERLD